MTGPRVSLRARRAAERALGITAEELVEFHVRERRPHIKKRLRALRHILLGKTPQKAARLVKAGEPSVYRWIKVVQRGGLEALARDTRGQHPIPRPEGIALADRRTAIRVALQQHLDSTSWTRLTAIECVLLGSSFETAAREAGRSVETVKTWVWRFHRGGVAAVLGRPRHGAMHRPPSASELLRLAASEKNRRIAKRFRAMARLGAGLNHDNVALHENTTAGTVRKWQAAFMAGGLDALRYPAAGRRRLTARQLGMLRKIILARPEISTRALCDVVRERFGINYSPSWMAHIVQRLGFEKVGERFQPFRA